LASGGKSFPGGLDVVDGDLELSDGVLVPFMIFDAGIQSEIELCVDGHALHLQVASIGNRVFGDSLVDASVLDFGPGAGESGILTVQGVDEVGVLRE